VTSPVHDERGQECPFAEEIFSAWTEENYGALRRSPGTVAASSTMRMILSPPPPLILAKAPPKYITRAIKAIAEFRSEFGPSEPSSCRFIYLRRQQCLDALRLSHYVNQHDMDWSLTHEPAIPDDA
jgi:hypothetical protein